LDHPLRGKERTFTESLRFENALHIARYFTWAMKIKTVVTSQRDDG
jgi:hypothetical protein